MHVVILIVEFVPVGGITITKFTLVLNLLSLRVAILLTHGLQAKDIKD